MLLREAALLEVPANLGTEHAALTEPMAVGYHAVVRGQPPESLRLKLQDRLETLHFQFANDFVNFSGDAAPFASSRAILEECLDVVLDTDRGGSRPSRWVWARWATPLLLLIGVLVFLKVRSARRFDAALTRLRAEPGLQVISAERRGGAWRIQGLKDQIRP